MTDRLFYNLKKNKDFYYSWQSNIAMAFVDSYYRCKEKNGKKYLSRSDIHKIANEAAKNFLNVLIKSRA